jgi:hypothetical protein
VQAKNIILAYGSFIWLLYNVRICGAKRARDLYVSFRVSKMKRRKFLTGLCTGLVTASGCVSDGSQQPSDGSQTPTEDSQTQPAHTVTVYLGEREATRNVTVTVENENGESLFDKEYRLSDSNEADEDATFPESTEPETVTVTVDGNRFEKQWPGFENQRLPCQGENRAGIELWIEGNPQEAPSVRMETNCQHVTMNQEQKR